VREARLEIAKSQRPKTKSLLKKKGKWYKVNGEAQSETKDNQRPTENKKYWK